MARLFRMTLRGELLQGLEVEVVAVVAATVEAEVEVAVVAVLHAQKQMRPRLVLGRAAPQGMRHLQAGSVAVSGGELHAYLVADATHRGGKDLDRGHHLTQEDVRDRVLGPGDAQ